MHNCIDYLIAFENLLCRELAGEHDQQFLLYAIQCNDIFGIDSVHLLDFGLEHRQLCIDDDLQDSLLQLFESHLEIDDLQIGQKLHRIITTLVSLASVRIHRRIQIQPVFIMDWYILISAFDAFLFTFDNIDRIDNKLK